MYIKNLILLYAYFTCIFTKLELILQNDTAVEHQMSI